MRSRTATATFAVWRRPRQAGQPSRPSPAPRRSCRPPPQATSRPRAARRVSSRASERRGRLRHRDRRAGQPSSPHQLPASSRPEGRPQPDNRMANSGQLLRRQAPCRKARGRRQPHLVRLPRTSSHQAPARRAKARRAKVPQARVHQVRPRWASRAKRHLGKLRPSREPRPTLCPSDRRCKARVLVPPRSTPLSYQPPSSPASRRRMRSVRRSPASRPIRAARPASRVPRLAACRWSPSPAG